MAEDVDIDSSTRGVEISLADKLADQERKCRSKATELGINVNTALLGKTIYNISGDLTNRLEGPYGIFGVDKSLQSRDELFLCMDYESESLSQIISSSSGELLKASKELESRIKQTKEKLEKSDWVTREGFMIAHGILVRELRDWVRERSVDKPENQNSIYRKAFLDYQRIDLALRESGEY